MGRLQRNGKVILRHFIMWTVFICYEVAFVYFTVGLRSAFIDFAVFYALNIALFYFNAHVILDFAFFRTRAPYLVSGCLILLEIAVYLVIKFAADYLLAVPGTTLAVQLGTSKLYILNNIWRGIYFIGFSTAYWAMLYMLRFREKNYRMETEQLKDRARTLELENAFLQNQISPHLLFNTLNFIYNSVHRVSERAGNGVLMLSDLMRYSLITSKDDNMVSLESELEQVVNLIGLSRLRFGDVLYLDFIQDVETAGLRILPLILVTLVENMIKHGDLGNREAPAVIRLKCAGGRLFFETANRKRCGSPHLPGGLGLANLDKRLANCYGSKYRLHISDEQIFLVNLTLDL